MRKLCVYLSGGFHSDWQDVVMDACKNEPINFLNPLEKEKKFIKEHGAEKWQNIDLTEEEKEEKDKARRQSPWWYQDKLAIEKADIVFCYLEDYRPKLLGTGTVFELGMAFALGKLVIVVNQIEHRYYREFERLFTSFPTLVEGVEHLKKCGWLHEG